MVRLDNNSLTNLETAKEFAQNVVINYENSIDGVGYSKLATAIEKNCF